MTAAETVQARAVLAAAHAHGPGKSVQITGSWRAPRRPAITGTPCRALAELGPFGQALHATLTTALAPRRWEPLADHNDHRAYPSARAAHLHTAALRVPGADTAVAIDPVRGLLGGPVPPSGPWDETATATIELSVAPERLRPGYGPLRDAIALLETGHVLGALTEAAAAHGLAADCALSATATTAAIATHTVDLHTADPGGGDSPRTHLEPVATVTVRHSGEPEWPMSRTTAVRTSGLAPHGLSADPRPLAPGTLQSLADAALRRPPGSPARLTQPAARRLGHHLVVRATADRPGAVYRARPAAGSDSRPRAESTDLRRALPAPTPDALRRCLLAPSTAIDAAAIPVIWVITADVAAAVAESPDAYGRLLLTVGAAAQHVCTAAAAAGMFCRPVRGFDEARLEALVGADAGQDVLYALLIGRPRLPAIGYDLTDPCPEGWS